MNEISYLNSGHIVEMLFLNRRLLEVNDLMNYAKSYWMMCKRKVNDSVKMKKTQSFLREYLPFIKLRKNEVVIRSSIRDYMIPSELFPVLNKSTLKVFTYADTVQLPNDTKLAELYNQIDFKVGHCYQNIEIFSELLKKNNLNDYKIYTGWIVMGGLPVHHCWMTWKDKHLIDPGVTLIENLFANKVIELSQDETKEMLTTDEQRELFLQIREENIHKSNVEIRTFGQAAPLSFYVGTETTPMQGRILFNKLMEDFPEHPSYASRGMNGQDESTLQRMIREAEQKK